VNETSERRRRDAIVYECGEFRHGVAM